MRGLIGATLLGMAFSAMADERPPSHETLRISSVVMAEPRRVNVYLPPDYDRSPDVAYPVLYMPDGGEEEDFPHVARTVDELIRAHQIPPMLVVGIENTQRRRDMTGPTEVESDRKIAPRVGGSAAFRGFIADELMPAIRARYRVSDQTAIMGESLAGLFAIETLFLRPELFDTYIALDPSLWWNDRQWLRQAPERLRLMRNAPVRLYVATGDTEQTNARHIEPFAQVLRANTTPVLQWQYVMRPELHHDTIYRGLEREALTQLFGTHGAAAVPAASTRP
jgi:predicted alpha/beta superfamily hydrolase